MELAISCCCMVSGDVQQCYTAKERRLQQHTSAQLHAGETVTLQKLVWIDWRDDRQAVLDSGAARRFASLKCARSRVTTNFLQYQQKTGVNGGRNVVSR